MKRAVFHYIKHQPYGNFRVFFRNKRSIEDKYCLRGAEWGVGDCSTAGMTPEERDNFIALLKQKAGVE